MRKTSLQTSLAALALMTCAASGPVAGEQANAGKSNDIKGNDGSVLLRMCKGADKVRALSVMCHSYLNGYLDAAHFFGKVGKTGFCLGAGDKEKVPNALVEWIGAHPESQSQPAGAVLQKALGERFPCAGKK